jgi:hypothetical protein
VTGFALAWPGQAHGVLWISGDTVLYDGVRQVAQGRQAIERDAAAGPDVGSTLRWLPMGTAVTV